MEKIIIHKLGPIDHCELKIDDFMVFTGPQASGKSTIAKSIFFFKNLKTLLWKQISRRTLMNNECIDLTIKQQFLKEIRSNFLQTFGTTCCMDPHMYIQYHYTDDIFVKINLKRNSVTPNYIWINLSHKLSDFIKIYDGKQSDLDIHNTRKEINEFFDDDLEAIYIPAGRNMMTVFSTQLMYWYSMMDDEQRRSLDYCTQNYLEKILELKTYFSQHNIDSLMIDKFMAPLQNMDHYNNLSECKKLMKEILHGKYENINGEERLKISKDQYVKINFTSSGQQEALWILNVIFYYLFHDKKMYLIIEEPESHLFPNAQKLITEFISLAKNNGSEVLLTTHSPYILGTINNLLYANKISKEVDIIQLNRIIDQKKWISFDRFGAYYLENGKVDSCMDEEFESIKNEVIDDVSDEINDDYDKMLALKVGKKFFF